MSLTWLFTILFIASGVLVGVLTMLVNQRHAARLTGVMLIMYACGLLTLLFGVK